MLSRVAEHIYWMTRYVERAENIARLMNVNSHLLLDLPKRMRLGWEPIIDILGCRELFFTLNDSAAERQVLRFVISDLNNPGSILSTLRLARENARTIRDIIPREAWEHINDVYQQASKSGQSGLSPHKRYDYLRSIILGSQTLTGMLAGTMIVSDRSQEKKILWLFGLGFLSFMLGSVWNWFFPLNKKLKGAGG